MAETKPLILISNDDGIDAPGIRSLVDSIADMAEIIVVAPRYPQSGKASAITIESPLHLTKCDDYNGATMYMVDGTPVDCIKLALHTACPRRPDMVLSGINHGSNSGNSVIYSGTMGAVMEACMVGIPSIGFSLLHHSWAADFSKCGPIIREIVSKTLSKGLPSGICLNVNIPARCTPKGIRTVEAARGYWTEEYKEYTAPHGRPFYLLTGKFINAQPDNPSTDNYWLDREYATVVPVRPDQTASDTIASLSRLYDTD